MTLLVDAGNSRFKWARSASPQDVHVRDYRQTGYVETLIAWLQDEGRDDALICSVLGDSFRDALGEWATREYPHSLEFVTTAAAAHGVEIAYEQPHNLGADRFVSLIATHNHYPGNSVLADCGTAITLDAITAAGKHLGGLIIPGLALMRRSLSVQTMEIGSRCGAETHLFAHDTPDAVYSGTLRAAATAVDGVGADMAEALGGDVSLVMSGGDAELLASLLDGRWQVDPYLVIKGLAVLAQ